MLGPCIINPYINLKTALHQVENTLHQAENTLHQVENSFTSS